MDCSPYHFVECGFFASHSPPLGTHTLTELMGRTKDGQAPLSRGRTYSGVRGQWLITMQNLPPQKPRLRTRHRPEGLVTRLLDYSDWHIQLRLPSSHLLTRPPPLPSRPPPAALGPLPQLLLPRSSRPFSLLPTLNFLRLESDGVRLGPKSFKGPEPSARPPGPSTTTTLYAPSHTLRNTQHRQLLP